MNLRLFFAVSLVLASGQAFGQVNISRAGVDPYGPRNLGAIQQAMPGAQVSQIGPDGRIIPVGNPAQLPIQMPGQLPGQIPGQLPPQDTIDPTGLVQQTDQDQGAERKLPPSPEDEAALETARWAAGAADQQLRQTGRTKGRGDQFFVSIASSTDADDRRTLYRWKTFLPQFGVHQGKVNYEANRLSRQDFDMWASRFVWEACHTAELIGSEKPSGCAQVGK